MEECRVSLNNNSNREMELKEYYRNREFVRVVTYTH